MSAAVLFLSAIGYPAFTSYVRLHKLQLERQKEEQAVRDLTIENVRRAAEVERLKHDPAAMEDIARRELKLAKPDETIYILPASERDKTRRSSAER